MYKLQRQDLIPPTASIPGIPLQLAALCRSTFAVGPVLRREHDAEIAGLHDGVYAAQIDRLCHIAVRLQVIGLNDVRLLARTRQHDYRDIIERRIAPDNL